MQEQVPRNRLLELRLKRGIRLRDIGIACDVYDSTVKRWQGHVIPHEHLATVARMLNVSVPYLTGWDDEEAPFEPKAAA